MQHFVILEICAGLHWEQWECVGGGQYFVSILLSFFMWKVQLLHSYKCKDIFSEKVIVNFDAFTVWYLDFFINVIDSNIG